MANIKQNRLIRLFKCIFQLFMKLLSHVKLPFYLLIAGSVLFLSNRGGSPGGRTGSNVDSQRTCGTNGGCHGPKTPIEQSMISTNIPETGYVPGQSYEITIEVSQAGRNVFGYEIMGEDANNNGVGTFANNADGNANGFRATHKFNSSSGTGGRTWVLDWTAPETGTGEITFYAAVLAANNNGNNGGDLLLVDTLSISEGATTSVSQLDKLNIRVSPNPASNYITISNEFSREASIRITNVLGKTVINQAFSHQIDVSGLPANRYVLFIESEGKIYRSSFIKL